MENDFRVNACLAYLESAAETCLQMAGFAGKQGTRVEPTGVEPVASSMPC